MMLRASHVLGLVLVIAATLGCGGRGGRGRGFVADSGPPAVDGGDPATRRISFVQVYSDTAGTGSHSAVARFEVLDPNPISLTHEDLGGGCELQTAELIVDPGMIPPVDRRDAGTITVTGGFSVLTLVRDVEGSYSVPVTGGRLWDGGELLDVTSTGGSDVPAFSGTLVAPAPVTVTSPALAPDAPLAIGRSTPLTVGWTGGGPGEVLVLLAEAVDTATIRRALTCRFSPSAGRATIPAPALARLSAGDGIMLVDVASESEVTTPGWGSVDLEMRTGGVTDFGPYATEVVFR